MKYILQKMRERERITVGTSKEIVLRYFYYYYIFYLFYDIIFMYNLLLTKETKQSKGKK